MGRTRTALGSATIATAGCLAFAAPAAQADNTVCESMREQSIGGRTYPKIELCMTFYNLESQKIREVKFTVKALTSKGLGSGKVYFVARGTVGGEVKKTWNDAIGLVTLPGTTTAWACRSYSGSLALKSATPCGRYEGPSSPGAPEATSVSFVGIRTDAGGTKTIDSLTSSGFYIK